MFNIYKKYWIGALVSAVFFVLMLPCSTGHGIWPIRSWACCLSWFFLVPLWSQIRNESKKNIFIFGFVYSLFSSLATLYWVYTAVKKYGGLSTPLALFIMIAFIVAESLIRNMAFFFSSFFIRYRAFPFIAALFFATVEWILYYGPFDGFPWITASHALYPMRHMVQIIDVIGIVGMNFAVYYINFLIVDWWKARKNHVPHAYYVKMVVGIWIVFFVYGVVQLHRYRENPDAPSLNIALLQGNISQDLKWNVRDRQGIIETYRDLTKIATQAHPDLIVWPEASLPRTLAQGIKNIDVVSDLTDIPTTLIGAPTWSAEDGITQYHNSAFTLAPNGDVIHRYDKVQLVPFGEYTPSFGFIPVQKLIPAVAGNFSPGSLHQDISEVKGHPFGIFICYESLFPDIARSWVKQGAEFFAGITNDAWFDLGSGPYQHLEFSGLRAIEYRKPVLRAANTGISTWFDETGKRFEMLDLQSRGYLIAKIYPNKIRTIYSQFPYAVPAFLWLLFGYIISRRKTI